MRRPAAAAPSRAAAFAALLLAAAALGALGWPPETLLVVEPQALAAAAPRLALELPPGATDGGAAVTVLVETSLSHAVGVAAGAPVATVRFAARPDAPWPAGLAARLDPVAAPAAAPADASAATPARLPAGTLARTPGAAPPGAPARATAGDGRSPSAATTAGTEPPAAAASADEPSPGLARPSPAWALRAGVDTAEWAIRRPDVAAAAAHPAPAPWLGRVTAEGFFGLVFRSEAELAVPPGAGWLIVERDPGLPAEAVVHLHRLEVRR